MEAAKTIEIACNGYSVAADIYKGQDDKPVLLALIGRASHRKESHHVFFLSQLAATLGITAVTFDYTGHGDSPFDLASIYPAQHLLEVVTVFDWMRQQYPNRQYIISGYSYGGYWAAQLAGYRQIDALILQTPAIYRPADMYVCRKDEDMESIRLFRQNATAIAAHSMFAAPSLVSTTSLLIVHDDDERIPKETTDVYRNILHAHEITVKKQGHQLEILDRQHVQAYYRNINKWLKTTFKIS